MYRVKAHLCCGALHVVCHLALRVVRFDVLIMIMFNLRSLNMIDMIDCLKKHTHT